MTTEDQQTATRLWLPAVYAGALAVGFWSVSGVYADPVNRIPDTPFSAGCLFAGSLARAEVWLHGYVPDHTHLLAWPGGAAYFPVMWPLLALALVVDPVVALWLTMALTPVVNALGGAFLARTLGFGRREQALAGALLAVNPWIRETLANGQLEQTWPGAIAALWAVAIRVRERPTVRRLAGLGLLAFLAGTSLPHLALGGAIGIGAWFLVEGARSGDWRKAVRWPVVLSLGALGLGVALAGAWHAAGYASAVSVFAPKGSGGTPTGIDGLPEAASLTMLLLPPAPPASPSGVLHCVWLGWGVPVAATVGALLPRNRAIVAGPVAACVTLLVLSLGASVGGVPLPWGLIAHFSSTIAQSGSAYRMVGAATIPLALLAALGPRTRVASIALIALAWVETARFGTRPMPYLALDIPRDPVVDAIDGKPGPILDLPLGSRVCPAGHYAEEATRRRRPVTLNTAGQPYASTPGLLHRFADVETSPRCIEDLRGFLSTQGYTGVVLHDHGCRIPDALRTCLAGALGDGQVVPMEGTSATGGPASITWWTW